MALETSSRTSALANPTVASHLNFLQRMVPGGCRHLRSGWNAVAEGGIMDRRRAG